MLQTPFLVCLGAGGVVAGISAWFGWKNLKQAEVLRNPVAFARLGANVGRAVALSGRPENLYEGNDPTRRAHIYFKRIHEHYRRGAGNKGGRWVTDGTEEWLQEFALHGDGGTVRVADRPTEVHGTTNTSDRDGGGLFSEEKRIRTEAIEARVPLVTVCGKLSRQGEGFRITADPELGLLLSTYGSAGAAAMEATKGWVGLVVVPLVWAVACAVLFLAKATPA